MIGRTGEGTSTLNDVDTDNVERVRERTSYTSSPDSVADTMSYPGRHGQHYQYQNGGGGPPSQMPMPNQQYGQPAQYNQGRPSGYGPPPGQYGSQPAPYGPPGGQGQPPMAYGQPGQMTTSNYQGQRIKLAAAAGHAANGWKSAVRL